MSDSKQTTVNLTKQKTIGIITINYPPVNALSQSVRQGVLDGVNKFEADSDVSAIIIRCEGKTFIAGADIKEFGQPPSEPFLPDVVNRIAASKTPVIASLFGTTLGGGFEVALACHYRVAFASARVGLPEVNLGLIPGAGGTQRLPKIVGVEKAIEMVTSGQHYKASEFASSGLFHRVVPDNEDLFQATLNFAEKLENDAVEEFVQAPAADLDWPSILNQVKKKARGKDAPVVAAQVIQQTWNLPVNEGMKIEREAFLKLRESEQSAALRYVFGAEKQSAKTDLNAEPIDVQSVGVIGAGNMGSGIATAFLQAGYSVQLIEQTDEALAGGVERISKNLNAAMKRGLMSQASLDDCLNRLATNTDYGVLADCQLVIEAIFEDIKVKQAVFSQLDKVCHADCILATNTSYLDINTIATAVKDPSRVIGMHFFSPANIMKLVEIVQAEKSSPKALVTAMTVAKKLRKMPILVGVCFGFAGNRMYTRYGREIQQMLLEGAAIEQVDKALTDWGMAMGPLAVQDLSGIDIGHNARSAQPFPEYDPGYFRAAAVMVENGRLGRKTGKGFYAYDEAGKPQVDAEAETLIREKAQALNIQQRQFSDAEIVERALLALISEGLTLFKEGIVSRLSDIDVIWLHGYGFPRHKGGPMFQARQMGASQITDKLAGLREMAGAKIWPEVDCSSLTR